MLERSAASLGHIEDLDAATDSAKAIQTHRSEGIGHGPAELGEKQVERLSVNGPGMATRPGFEELLDVLGLFLDATQGRGRDVSPGEPSALGVSVEISQPYRERIALAL
jgi:hypothetical protein